MRPTAGGSTERLLGWSSAHAQDRRAPSLDEATSAGSRLLTSQLALPEQACAEAYATAGYEQSVTNLGQVSLESDNVFSDGWDAELATVEGDTTGGMTASLTVNV